MLTAIIISRQNRRACVPVGGVETRGKRAGERAPEHRTHQQQHAGGHTKPAAQLGQQYNLMKIKNSRDTDTLSELLA
jgi:hypothetical protein